MVAQSVENLPAVQETWVQSLGQEVSLEKEMANHSSILAWKIPWTEEPGGLQSMGCKESGTTEQLSLNAESLSHGLPRHLQPGCNALPLYSKGRSPL